MEFTDVWQQFAELPFCHYGGQTVEKHIAHEVTCTLQLEPRVGSVTSGENTRGKKHKWDINKIHK